MRDKLFAPIVLYFCVSVKQFYEILKEKCYMAEGREGRFELDLVEESGYAVKENKGFCWLFLQTYIGVVTPAGK